MSRKIIKRKYAVMTLAAIAAAGVCVALCFPLFVRLTVAGHKATGLPVCFLNDILNIRCPMCGGTRCVSCLMQSLFRKAFFYNPMVIITGAFFAEWYLRSWVRCLMHDKLSIAPDSRALKVLAVMWIIFTFIRNFPFYRAFFY